MPKRRTTRPIYKMFALPCDKFPIFRQQAHELLAAGARGVAAAERAPADEFLLLRHDPIHAEVLRRDAAVGLLADDDVALLGTQHVHRFRAVRREAVWRAGFD